MKQEQFIEEYLAWLRFRMSKVLPAEASPYRFMEIARRQHHFGVKDLIDSMRKITQPDQS